jgi:hypothetical protein
LSLEEDKDKEDKVRDEEKKIRGGEKKENK